MGISNPFGMNRSGHHPRVLVVSDNLNWLKEFSQSLCYSTHVQIFIATQKLLEEDLESFNINVIWENRKITEATIAQFIISFRIDWVFRDYELSKVDKNEVIIDFGRQQDDLIQFKLNRDTVEVNNLRRHVDGSIAATPEVKLGENYLEVFKNSRIYGFNIPLNIVQGLIGRKQVFIQMVNDDCVFYKNIVYYSYSNFFFDLDETLILLGKPVQVAVNLIFELHKLGIQMYLVTRHKWSVPVTLNKIGLNVEYFKSIHKVKTNEKKSDIISELGGGRFDFFIDNEFPERFDVRTNTELNVLDVNQIMFLQLKL